MVALFASLKWRLVTSRIRAQPAGRRAGVIVGLAAAGLLVLVTAFGLSRLSAAPQAGFLVVSGLYAALLVGWMLTPLIAFGVDETVDPSRFALLPLRPSVLQRGLLVASLVGYLPAANAVVLIGAAVGLAFQGWMLPVTLICAALQLVTCVVLSRAASTSMSTLMSSRRGRDLGMLVGVGILVAYLLVNLFLSQASNAGIGAGAARVAEVLTWTPPGALASLPLWLAVGDSTRAVAAALTGLAVLALGWWWWGRALRRSLVTVDSSTAGSAPSRGLGSSSVTADGMLATARVVAGRDRTLMWRDPMRRIAWLMALFITVVWPFVVVRGSGAVFACVLGAGLFGAQAANQFGIDGSGLWLHLVAIADRVRARGEILGHTLVVVLPSMLLLSAAMIGVAAVRDEWAVLPAAAGVCFAVMLGATAAGVYLSARQPYAMPQSRKSMFASSVPGQKGVTFRSALGTLLGGALTALPIVGLAVLSTAVDPVWGWLALVAGVGYPTVLVFVAVRLAADRYLATGPEILEQVRAGDRV